MSTTERTLAEHWEKNHAVSGEYAHFLKLDAEKQERILTTASAEFLEKGYGEASTNAITHKAGISKGLLFHYFGSKEGLYKFLMEESARRIAGEVFPALDISGGDVFGIIKTITRIKMEICARYPIETNFLAASYAAQNLPEALRTYREKFKGVSYDLVVLISGTLDKNLLAEGVELKVAADIISWVCQKFTDDLIAERGKALETRDWEPITEKLDKYFDALKRGLYKQ